MSLARVMADRDTPAQRWSRRLARLEPVSWWIFGLAFAVPFAELAWRGCVATSTVMNLSQPLSWLALGIGGVRIFAGIPVTLWRRRELDREWQLRRSAQYPAGGEP